LTSTPQRLRPLQDFEAGYVLFVKILMGPGSRDAEPEALKSALATVVNREIRGFEQRLKQLEKNSEAKINKLTNVTFTKVAILVAALAVDATSNLSTAVTLWTWGALFVSVFALLVAWGKWFIC